VTHVTRDQIIHVTRARVTAISRFPVTCVTSGIEGGRKGGLSRLQRDNKKAPKQIDRPAPRPRCRPRALSGQAIGARHNKLSPLASAGVTPLRCCSYPRRFPVASSDTALRRKAVRYQRLASSRRAKTLCWGHIGRGMRARTASTPFTLVDAALAGPILINGRRKTPAGAGVEEIHKHFHRVISSASLAAAPKNSGAGPSEIIVRHCRTMQT
jgi:hypothetical protein